MNVHNYQFGPTEQVTGDKLNLVSDDVLIAELSGVRRVGNIAQLRALYGVDSYTGAVGVDLVGSVLVLGYYEESDGGAGIFYYDPGSTVADNNGTIIKPTIKGGGDPGRWVRQLQAGQPVLAEWFGAVGDGATDDTAPIVAGLGFAGAVQLLSKTYAVAGRISLVSGNQVIGAGVDATVIKLIDASSNCDGNRLPVFKAWAGIQQNLLIEDLTIDCNFDNQAKDTTNRVKSTVDGLSLACENSTIRRVKVIHFGCGSGFGGVGSSEECFPIAVGPGSYSSSTHTDDGTSTGNSLYGECVVENCIVTQAGTKGYMGKVGTSGGVVIDGVVVSSDSVNTTVSYPTSLGEIYQVQSSLNQSTWSSAGSQTIGTGSVLTFVEAISNPVKYYRVLDITSATYGGITGIINTNASGTAWNVSGTVKGCQVLGVFPSSVNIQQDGLDWGLPVNGITTVKATDNFLSGLSVGFYIDTGNYRGITVNHNKILGCVRGVQLVTTAVTNFNSVEVSDNYIRQVGTTTQDNYSGVFLYSSTNVGAFTDVYVHGNQITCPLSGCINEGLRLQGTVSLFININIVDNTVIYTSPGNNYAGMLYGLESDQPVTLFQRNFDQHGDPIKVSVGSNYFPAQFPIVLNALRVGPAQVVDADYFSIGGKPLHSIQPLVLSQYNLTVSNRYKLWSNVRAFNYSVTFSVNGNGPSSYHEFCIEVPKTWFSFNSDYNTQDLGRAPNLMPIQIYNNSISKIRYYDTSGGLLFVQGAFSTVVIVPTTSGETWSITYLKTPFQVSASVAADNFEPVALGQVVMDDSNGNIWMARYVTWNRWQPQFNCGNHYTVYPSITYNPSTNYSPTLPDHRTGLLYKVTQHGISGTTEPTWPTVSGQTVSDGTVIWMAVDPLYEISDPALSAPALPESTTPPVDAYVTVNIGGSLFKVQRQNLLYHWYQILSMLDMPTTTSPNFSDYLWISSAGQNYKATISTLKVLLSKTEIPSGSNTSFISDLIAFPSGPSYALIQLAHNLDKTPRSVEWVLVCIDSGGDQGFALNEEIPIYMLRSYSDSGSTEISNLNAFVQSADSVNVYLKYSGSGIRTFNKATTTTVTLTNSKWSIRCYASSDVGVVSSGGNVTSLFTGRPVFIPPVTVANTINTTFTTVDLSAHVPASVKTVILQGSLANYDGSGGSGASIEIRSDSSSPAYQLIRDYGTSGGRTSDSSQGLFPLTNGTFQYRNVGSGSIAFQIDVIGYINVTDQNVYGGFYESDLRALPSTGTANQQITFNHGLGDVPKVVRGVLVCQVPENNYVAGEEVELDEFTVLNESGAFSVTSNITSVTVGISPEIIGTFGRIGQQTSDQVFFPITRANWQLKVYAFDVLLSSPVAPGGIREFVSSPQPIPSTFPSAIFVPHGLSVIPSTLRWVFKCIGSNAQGYAIGDEVALESCFDSGSVYLSAWTSLADDTTCTLNLQFIPELWFKDTSSRAVINPSSWVLVVRACDTLAASNKLSLISSDVEWSSTAYSVSLGLQPSWTTVDLSASVPTNVVTALLHISATGCTVMVRSQSGSPELQALISGATEDAEQFLINLSSSSTFDYMTVGGGSAVDIKLLGYVRSIQDTIDNLNKVTTQKAESGLLAIPTSDGTAVTFSHGLDAVPDQCEVRLVCMSDQSSLGVVAGIEIPYNNISSPFGYGGGSTIVGTITALSVSNASVSVSYKWGTYPLYAINQSTGLPVLLDISKWKIKITAFLRSGTPNPSTRYISPSDTSLVGSGVGIVDEVHGLGSVPDTDEWFLIAQSGPNDQAWSSGDMIPVSQVSKANGTSVFYPYKNVTNVGLRYYISGTSDFLIINKTTGVLQAPNLSQWKLRCYATRLR